MSVPKTSPFLRVSTFLLQQKYNEKRVRLVDKLMLYHPNNQASMNLVLNDLRVLHEELEKA